MADLEENLKEMGKTLKDVPIVIQYNKRDMPDAMSIADLEREVNIHAFPYIEAVAKTGDGVFPTLKDLSARVLDAVNKGGLSHARPKAAPKPAQVKAPTESAPVAIAAPPSHAHSAPMRVPGAATAARPAAARAGSPSYGGVVHPSGGSSVAVAEPPTASVSVPPARRASGEHYTPRSMQERVVAVSGLGRRRGGKVFVLLLLAAVVGAAAWFVLHR
jgi:hypothetical protein